MTKTSRAELRDLVRAGAERPAIEVAQELAAAGSFVSTAELSADPSLSPRQRVIALLAVGLHLVKEPHASLPDASLDAIDDAETVDAAIGMGLSGALTSVLAAAPTDAALNPTRRMIGRRMLAAGENGPHVVQLLRDAGDHERAARAAADDLETHLDLPSESPEVLVRLHVAMQWARDAEFFVSVLQRLHRAHLVRFGELVGKCPGLPPDVVRSVRAAIDLALTPGTHEPSRR